MQRSYLACALLFCGQLYADDMITIGGEQKFAQGLLRSAESGDVACYLSLEDGDGAPFTEMANFELCETATGLIGREVKLEYVKGTVLADSCQGDPECQDSQAAILVSKLTATKKTQGAYGPTHCQSGEFEVFGCTVDGGKLVNVCADRTGKPGNLQYRFGKPSSLELKLPAQPAYPNASIYGRNEAFAGGGGAWLRFSNAAYGYVVYTGIGRWGKNGETMTKQGVVVEKNGKQIANLACIDTPRSELGPDWFEALGIDREREDEFWFPE